MTKILFLSTDLTTEISLGGNIITYQYLQELSKHFDVELINFYSKNEYNSDLKIKLTNIPTPLDAWGKLSYPDSISKEIISNTSTTININNHGTNNYDFLFCSAPEQYKYLNQFSNAKKIYLVNNSQYQKARNSGININNVEYQMCKHSDINLFLTNSDFIYFKSLGLVRKNDQVITPFIIPKKINSIRTPNTILLTTNLEADYNKESLKWFLEEVSSLINPAITINVTGKGDFSKIKEVYPNINFLGFLSREELENLYSTTKLYVNPTIHGSGIQVKTLEALSYGMQVVSTKYSNIFPNVISSSDNPTELANIINSSIDSKSSFNYEYFNNINIEKFLELFEI